MPYFLRKTRPRGSYALLGAFLPSCGVAGGGASPSHTPPHHIPHSNAQHYPIPHHIDEDALEGVYFAFSLILRCLPYFLRKTRPRGSYALLGAFLPSCGGGVGSAGLLQTQTRTHLGAWNPESRSIYHSRAGNPNLGLGTPWELDSPAPSSPTHPARPILIPPPSSPPHPARLHPYPAVPRLHTRRGCPRRALFRVLGNPKVFALLFAKNAS